MIREWENFYRKTGKQKAKDQRASGRCPAEKPSPNRLSTKALQPSEVAQDKDLLCCQEGLCSASPLRTWTKQHKPDQRIAFGKYSPLEKELLRLGGVHTAAARRFLTYKQDEERRMLKELHLLSSDYKRAMEHRKHHSPPCPQGGPLKKTWTAKVTVPTEEFQMPPREQLTVRKHIDRLQLARALHSKHLLPHIKKFRDSSFLPGECRSPGSEDQPGGEDENDGACHFDAAKQEEKGKAEPENTGRPQLKMKVTFRSEEPKKLPACHPNDRKPFLPTKKRERCITGLTNRNLLHVAEFPGDLMLMSQDFIARGLHPGDGSETCVLGGGWRESRRGTALWHH